jgi:hypothetical protein
MAYELHFIKTVKQNNINHNKLEKKIDEVLGENLSGLLA